MKSVIELCEPSMLYVFNQIENDSYISVSQSAKYTVGKLDNLFKT